MVQNIPLTISSNQKFTVTLDGTRWAVSLVDVGGMMAVSVSKNSTPLVTNSRVVCGEPFIPYRYMESGNFIFVTSDDAFPYWPNFGASQFLFYLNALEISKIEPLKFLGAPSVGYLFDDAGLYITTDEGSLLLNA